MYFSHSGYVAHFCFEHKLFNLQTVQVHSKPFLLPSLLYIELCQQHGVYCQQMFGEKYSILWCHRISTIDTHISISMFIYEGVRGVYVYRFVYIEGQQEFSVLWRRAWCVCI